MCDKEIIRKKFQSWKRFFETLRGKIENSSNITATFRMFFRFARAQRALLLKIQEVAETFTSIYCVN